MFVHKMTLFGKVLLILVGFGFGLATGYYTGKQEGANLGNKIEVNVDAGNIKKDGEVNINLEDIKQNKEDKKKEDKKFLGIF